MDAYNHARELVLFAECQLQRVVALHAECLRDKQVKPPFLIEVKNYMENLRSALDFVAGGLFRLHGKAEPGHRCYFPYAPQKMGLVEFRAKKKVDKAIPGISAKRPDVVARIENYQHWGNHGNTLPIFMELNNENKHTQLTPQVEKEQLGFRITVTIPPKGTFEMPIEPKGLNEFLKQNQIPVIAWKGLEFETNGVVVIPFLTGTLALIRVVVNELTLA